ncbi:hypothetical protein D3C71_2048910 [compost metagenome]
MVDLDHVAITAGIGGSGDGACTCCAYVCAGFGLKINAGMQGWLSQKRVHAVAETAGYGAARGRVAKG